MSADLAHVRYLHARWSHLSPRSTGWSSAPLKRRDSGPRGRSGSSRCCSRSSFTVPLAGRGREPCFAKWERSLPSSRSPSPTPSRPVLRAPPSGTSWLAFPLGALVWGALRAVLRVTPEISRRLSVAFILVLLCHSTVIFWPQHLPLADRAQTATRNASVCLGLRPRSLSPAESSPC